MTAEMPVSETQHEPDERCDLDGPHPITWCGHFKSGGPPVTRPAPTVPPRFFPGFHAHD